MKYYVLGKKDNEMITQYQDLYYKDLVGFLESLRERGYLVEEITSILEVENRKFILNGEVSSLISILKIEVLDGKTFNIHPVETLLQQLGDEIGYFIRGEEGKLSMNKGNTIGETDIRISDYDLNPWGYETSHPDHAQAGGTRGWGEKPEEEWLEVYEKTFSILKDIDEGVYDELNHMIHKIVPFGTAYSLHNSCSHKNCVGNLYLGLTVDVERPELNNVEAVIHESSHNKLNLIMQQDPLILNDLTEKYYSPYRPDARHIHGVYLGIHAFVPTIYIMMKAYAKGYMGDSIQWLEKIILYYIKNRITYKVLLKHGSFTPLGQEILDEVYEVIRMTDEVFLSIPQAKEIFARVKEYEHQHFQEVNINYPHLEY